MTIIDRFRCLEQTTQTKAPLPAHHRQQGHPTRRTTNQNGKSIIPAFLEKSKEDFMSKQPILKRSKTEPNTYYTPDGLYKVTRCTVRAYGWTICMRQEDGSYRAEARADTLDKARRLIN